jgi:hypothetical protein
MSDALKYSRYFLNELASEQREQGFGKSPMFTIWTDDDIIKGSGCSHKEQFPLQPKDLMNQFFRSEG